MPPAFRSGSSPVAIAGASLVAAMLAFTALLAPLAATPGRGPVARAADPDPLLAYLQAAATANGQHVEVTGDLVRVTDAAGDVDGAPGGGDDIVAAGYAWLPQIPDEMLNTWLACTAPTNFCAKAGSNDAAFTDGLWIFWAELATPFAADPTRRVERGPTLRQKTYATAPVQAGQAFGGASHAVIGRDDRGAHDELLFAYTTGFNSFRTHSRSRWDGEYVFVAVPKQKEVQTDIIGWDFYSYSSDGTPTGTRRDLLRGFGGTPLLDFKAPPTFEFKAGLASAAPSATPSAAPSPSASTAPSPSPSASASVAPSASASVAPSASSPPSSGGSILDALLQPASAIVAGIVLIIVGAFLLFGRPGRPKGGTAAGGAVIAVVSEDPCPPLIAAAKAAQAACEEGIRAATAAADAAKARAAEAEAARQALEKARAAREAAEKELEKRRQPPDPGRRLGSTSFGGRDVHVDEYDLWLQEQARAAANAAHEAALDAATTDAERQQADEDWMKELDSVDDADGLDEVRRRDKTGREQWVKEAEAALKAAEEAGAAAQAEATRTAEAAEAAKAEATAAKERADDACAKAKAAADAAADCIKLQTPAVPAEEEVPPPPPPPPPTPPTPPTPPAPPTPHLG